MTLATAVPIDVKNFDKSTKPSESFYKYVNGGWLSTAEIPGDRGSFNCFVELDELSKANLKAIFDESSKLEAGASIVADLYLSGMNEEAIEKDGIEPIKDLLNVIKQIENTDDVIKAVCLLHKEGMASALFYCASSNDSRDSKNNALLGGQSGLGLPDRDYYFDESKEKELTEYQKYISKIIQLAGSDKDAAELASSSVFEFEKALAAISLKKVDRRDPVKTYNKIAIADLSAKTPAINWQNYFSTLGISPKSIILENVEYFTNCSELVSSTKLATLKSYLEFHLLSSCAPYLGKDFVDAHFEFNGKVLSGTKELQSRWKRVIGFCGDEARDLVGKAYIEKHFPETAKKAAKEMVDYIVEAFRHRIKTVDWMQDATRVKALQKLDKFTVKIGYPDKWIDYSPLKGKISRDSSFLANIRQTSAFNAARELAEYNQPADKLKWHMPPYLVNAYFNPPLNEIVFPAAILAEPFFFPPTKDHPLGQPALSFGAIGGVISHEISHGYDDQGRKYDHEGNLVDWWLPEDGQNFDARAEKIIKQFDKFTVLGKPVNGKLTQGENIADLGGLSVSYAAFQSYIKAHGREQLPDNAGFTQEQQFFISWSQVWRNLMRDELALQRLITDPHSPGEYRVDGPLMNLVEFHKAFDVKEGDRMYAKEEERVSIW